MSDFPSMRARAGELIDRLLSQLEEKSDDLTSLDVAAIEKAVKTIVILSNEQDKSGKANPNRDVPTENLEEEFE